MTRPSITNDDVSSLITGINSDKQANVSQSMQAAEEVGEHQIGESDLLDNEIPRLGWFAGVTCPVTMSMFSSLLFLRVGYIVGNCGWLGSLMLLVLAYTILTLTVSSISAIATNGRIRSGGVYFMISRTMGLEIGASVGILIYVANVVASALYATGFAEGIVDGLGPSGIIGSGLLEDDVWTKTIISSALNCLNMIICIVGAKVFGRFTTLMLGLAIVCITMTGISFVLPTNLTVQFNTTEPLCVECTYSLKNGTFSGLLAHSPPNATHLLADNLFFDIHQDCEDVTAPVSLATIFSVLFSGVTGILAGANLSGELKDPSSDIPYGTHVGLGFTFVAYAILFILTGLTCDRTLLYNDCHYMADLMSPVSEYVVFFGILLCCWCSSCSCLIGGARTVHAVAVDVEHWLNPLAKSSRSTVILSWALVQAFIMVGSLNKIAQMCCVFFLLAYFAVNFACFCLDWASTPNFRPTFTMFHWSTALAGMAITSVLMFFINVAYASLSWLLCLVLFLIFAFGIDRKPVAGGRQQQHNWGRISQAIIFHQVRKYLLYLDPRLEHVKYWRPHILLLIDGASPSEQFDKRTTSILRFANDLKKGGLFLIGHVYEEASDSNEDPTVEGYRLWHDLIKTLNIKAFPQLTVVPHSPSSGSNCGQRSPVGDAMSHLVRLSGVGSVRPNTVMVAFPPLASADDPGLAAEHFLAVVHTSIRSHKSVCIYRNFDQTDDILNSQLADARGESVVDRCRRWPRLFRCRGGDEQAQPYHRMERTTSLRIDVWLVDWLQIRKSFSAVDDVTAIYMLQLACVLSMSRRWTGASIRVLIGDKSRIAVVSELTRTARVKAEIIVVNQLCTYTAEQKADCQDSHDGSSVDQIAGILSGQSRGTSVAFMYFQPTSVGVGSQNGDDHGTVSNLERLQNLEKLTEHLCPVVFVHGTECVISD